MVRGNTERLRLQRQTAPAFLVSFDTGETVAARIATTRPREPKRKRERDEIVARCSAQIFPSADVDLAVVWKTGRISPSAIAGLLAEKTSACRARAIDRKLARFLARD